MPPTFDAAEHAGSWPWVLAGVFSTSLATLLAELALTRIFSVILFYHFAFMAISVALLGLGAGGLFSYFLTGWLERGRVWPRLAIVAALNGLGMAIALGIILRQSIWLEFSAETFESLAIVYFSAMLPFLGSGLVLAVALARTAQWAGTVYFADLAGAGLGCLLLIPLLEWLGGPNTLLAAATLWGLSAVFWSAAGRRRWKFWLLVPLLFVVAIAMNTRRRYLDIRYAKGKEIRQEVFSRWNSFSRVGVERTESGEYLIRIDADAATWVADAPPERHEKWDEQLRDFTAAVVYRLRLPGRVLILGPGGGVDVARALAAGSRQVTGVEINPIIVGQIMRGVMRPNSFGLYDRPDVRIVVEDGRSFVRRSPEQYDVIQATLVDTWASTAAGAFALTENNLYTVEAFQEYLRHLTSGGIISITRWEFQTPREALRLVALGLEALKREGAPEPSRHFIAVADRALSSMGTTATVLMKRTPFTEEETDAAEYAVATGGKTMQLLAAPGLSLPNAFSQLLRSPQPESFYARYSFDISPVDDNRPFFFFMMRSGDALKRWRREPSMDLKINLGFALLLGVLLLSGAAVAAFLFLPAFLTRRVPRGSGLRRWLLYFVGIGLAYIIAEIAFIQKLVLFLGHPTYALAVAVFSLLLSSALGSRNSQRWPEPDLAARVRRWILALAGLLVVLGLLATPLVTRLVWLPLPLRILLAAVLLAPCGFVMGTAFPSGLRLVRMRYPGALEWAWAMNAAASVLGSAAAIFLSIHFGIWQTMAAGAFCYLVAAALIPPSPAGVARSCAGAEFDNRSASPDAVV